jgi:hypothetical protein
VPVAGYLESGILTLVLPLGVLALVLLAWVFFVRTHPKDFE